MSATLTQIHDTLKKILDQASLVQQPTVITSRDRISIGPIVEGLNSVLSELQSQAVTLSSVLTKLNTIDTRVDGVEGSLTQIDTNTDPYAGKPIAQHVSNIAGYTNEIEGKQDSQTSLLTQIESAVDGLEGNTSQTGGKIITAHQVDHSTYLSAIDTNTDPFGGKPIAEWCSDMKSDLQIIEDNIQALEDSWDGPLGEDYILLFSIEATLLLIESAVDDLESDADDIRKAVEEQHNRNYTFAKSYEVTGIGGGTSLIIDLQVPTGQGLRNVSIRTKSTTSVNTLNIAEQITASSYQVAEPQPDLVVTANTWYHIHSDDSDEEHEWMVKGSHLISISWKNVAVNDEFEIIVSAYCRTDDKPTEDQTNATCTFTSTSRENEID